MIKFDELSLMCDLAETYHIYDYKQLSPQQIAVFSIGLRENSRIKMKMFNQSVPLETMLLAGIQDKLNISLWFKTKDGQKGINKPKMIVDILNKPVEKPKRKIQFNSGEEFEKYRQQLFGNGGEN
ncbi:DUF5361 domain-containing protein [Lactococcus petauri]|uniref:DUF5361 domain-containing protein n=1 Tax=Lactococcus petauri TaxID=1940789 RepID=UPI002890E127|nr:DUF5361 domain-containing protein [Lactococcus petauri]MDT2575980.1 DUF5361 domain-containing protein [Lactococcus petauri]